MALKTGFAAFAQPVCTDTVWPIFDHGKQLLDLSKTEEHLLMANIRNTILAYRLQSAAHFDVLIDVRQAFRVEDINLTQETKLNVLFLGFTETKSYVCRPVFRTHPRKKTRVATKKVDICDTGSGGYISLTKFLNMKYPSFPDSVGMTQMRSWWAANGKVFNWTSLPTELKEHVIQYCLHQPDEQWNYRPFRKRKNRFAGRYEPGVYEVVEMLTRWGALLAVSHQVRAITLRLCLIGNSEMIISGGFSVASGSRRALDSVLQRLGSHYQMTRSNSLPTDYTTQTLADCYMHYPRIYPHLIQYATFRHGIRKMFLRMNFINYMHFFKITTGGFERYLDADKPAPVSFEVFEQLPHLTEIALRMPHRPRQGWLDDPWQIGPTLFHHEFPCARALHRVIYERIAEVLAVYPNVKVNGFIDDYERDRFFALRESHMQNSKWTAAEYKELYTECGGGVELAEMVLPGSWLDEAEESEEQEEQEVADSNKAPSDIPELTSDAFFPPECRCETKCHLTFLEVESKPHKR
jgi:hypothetical protein